MQNRPEAGHAGNIRSVAVRIVTRYGICFQTQFWCAAGTAPLTGFCQRRLSLVDYKETERGKCETCGFFSKYGHGYDAPTPRFYEVEIRDRTDTNHIFSYFTPARHFACEIACFEHKVNFMREINRLHDQGQRDAKLLEMVRQDRHCEAWYPYRPGFSPKEHYEELQMQRLEEHRQALQLKLSEMERKALENSAKIAEDSRQLVSDLKDIAATSDRASRRVAYCVIVLAVLQVAFAAIAYFFPHESLTDKIIRELFGVK
jgi:hypothetical protein